jgi:Reverse transcriptase (RNA-dependent DNA polymerase)
MVFLIPKIKDSTAIQKFRPISIVDCCYKILSKILTNRLAPLMHSLIDPSQTTFIPSRYILDNVLVAHEIIHSVKIDKSKGLPLKEDFEKAYDKVN